MDTTKFLLKILIIDDNLANILLLKRMLNLAGYKNIETLTDSRQALELCETYDPDLILLDFRMPFMDGLEVMDALNSTQACNQSSIIMISAENEARYHNAALKKGAKDFITKPFIYNDIIIKIENALFHRLKAQS